MWGGFSPVANCVLKTAGGFSKLKMQGSFFQVENAKATLANFACMSLQTS